MNGKNMCPGYGDYNFDDEDHPGCDKCQFLEKCKELTMEVDSK